MVAVNKSNMKLVGAVVLAVILTFALCAWFFVQFPKMQHEKELSTYKRALFESTLCQYSCPLVNTTYQNRTQELPDKMCTDVCTATLQALNFSDKDFSNTELIRDPLFKDMESAIAGCRAEHTTQNATGKYIDNRVFFGCSSEALKGIVGKYEYLQ